MKELQNGRSMIEMLGVLAIIGVLSIGGLAGYTMAMNRHRANTILDYASRCVVVAQTSGDGSKIKTGSCKTILDNEPLPGGATAVTLGLGGTNNADIEVTVTHPSEKVKEALDNRNTDNITISEGKITFKGAGAGMTAEAVSSGS